MSLLASATVDTLKSVLGSQFRGFITRDRHGVDVLRCSDSSGSGLIKSDGCLASVVSDYASNLTARVGMGILVHGDANELMGRDEIVEKLLD